MRLWVGIAGTHVRPRRERGASGQRHPEGGAEGVAGRAHRAAGARGRASLEGGRVVGVERGGKARRRREGGRRGRRGWRSPGGGRSGRSGNDGGGARSTSAPACTGSGHGFGTELGHERQPDKGRRQLVQDPTDAHAAQRAQRAGSAAHKGPEHGPRRHRAPALTSGHRRSTLRPVS